MAATMRASMPARAAFKVVPAATRGYATSVPSKVHHQVVVVGAGTAGVTVAAQLKRARGSEKTDIAILDPASSHHYQVCFIIS